MKDPHNLSPDKRSWIWIVWIVVLTTFYYNFIYSLINRTQYGIEKTRWSQNLKGSFLIRNLATNVQLWLDFDDK